MKTASTLNPANTLFYGLYYHMEYQGHRPAVSHFPVTLHKCMFDESVLTPLTVKVNTALGAHSCADVASVSG